MLGILSRYSAATIIVFCSLSPVLALTPDQEKGMLRHGIWEWSLKHCPGALRNTGYWFALKEVGGFDSAQHIIDLENSRSFILGQKFMATNAENHGLEKTCDYAFEQWPAVLYRETGENTSAQ